MKKNNEYISDQEVVNKGRSMVEMLGVLAVIGVLTLIGIVAYDKMVARHKANVTLQQMNTIIHNMQDARLMAGNENFYKSFGATKAASAAGMETAIAMDIFPDDMLGDERTVTISSGSGSGSGFTSRETTMPTVLNAYRGEVYIISEDNGKTFSVVFEGLPKDAAILLGSTDWGAGDTSSLQDIVVVGEEQ